MYRILQKLTSLLGSFHLLVCWCAAFDSMICLSMSCKWCKAAVNAMTQGFVPFVDSAELACGALTAQRGAIFFTIPQVKQGEVYIHVNLPTESILYDDVYYWSALKHANQTRSRTNLSESSWWAVTLSMRCGHVQFRRKLWRTQSFWGQQGGIMGNLKFGCLQIPTGAEEYLLKTSFNEALKHSNTTSVANS